MAKRSADEANHGADKLPRKPSGVGSGGDAPFRGYINLNLTGEQKAAFAAWSQGEAAWNALEYHTSDGVNTSLKWVAKEGCFLASATQRRADSPNAGLVVTARGSGALLAFMRVLFCLDILSQGERWEDTQPLADPDRW